MRDSEGTLSRNQSGNAAVAQSQNGCEYNLRSLYIIELNKAAITNFFGKFILVLMNLVDMVVNGVEVPWEHEEEGKEWCQVEHVECAHSDKV